MFKKVLLILLLVASCAGFYLTYDKYQKVKEDVVSVKEKIELENNNISKLHEENSVIEKDIEDLKQANAYYIEEYELWQRKAEELLTQLP